MSDKLTFGELEIGNKFIAFPEAGDDAGHGGFKGGHVLYFKWIKQKPTKKEPKGKCCGKSFTHGIFSDIPDSMEVIKIV